MRWGERSVVLVACAIFAIACGEGSDDGADGGSGSADAGAIEGPLEIISFTATRDSVRPRESVELEWSVRGARIVDISSADSTLLSTFGQSGRISTGALEQTTVFTLTISRGGETKTATLEVVVDWPEVTIFNFSGTEMWQAFSTIVLQWSTTGAQYLRLLANDREIGRFTVGLENSFFNAFVDVGTTVFTLEAINPQHTASRSVTVIGLLPPAITKFNIRPRVIFSGTRTATITWDTTNATSTQLWDVFGRQVIGFPGTASGTVAVAIRSADVTDYRLSAYNGFVTTDAYMRIGPPVGELEPNEDLRFAQNLWEVAGVDATLSSADDVDVYAVFPRPGSSLQVRITGANGRGCDTDTRVELRGVFDSLEIDDDGGEPTARGDACGLIDPAVHPRARNLLESQYYIVVTGSESGRYVLITEEQ